MAEFTIVKITALIDLGDDTKAEYELNKFKLYLEKTEYSFKKRYQLTAFILYYIRQKLINIFFQRREITVKIRII